jgi:hypothetical protein
VSSTDTPMQVLKPKVSRLDMGVAFFIYLLFMNTISYTVFRENGSYYYINMNKIKLYLNM